MSVRMTPDRKELYSCNNSASYHIVGPDTAIEDIVSTGRALSATIYYRTDARSTASCAFYSGAGQLLQVKTASLADGVENCVSFTCEEPEAGRAKVMVVDGRFAPLCEYGTVELPDSD